MPLKAVLDGIADIGALTRINEAWAKNVSLAHDDGRASRFMALTTIKWEVAVGRDTRRHRVFLLKEIPMHAKLTELELRTIEKKLDERWAILQRDVHDELVMSAADSSVDLIGRPAPDGRDSSVMDALADLNLASIERHIHEIRAIKAATERIHNGTYGTCERCSRAISVARLIVNPSAELCLHCQSEFEKVGHAARAAPAKLSE